MTNWLSIAIFIFAVVFGVFQAHAARYVAESTPTEAIVPPTTDITHDLQAFQGLFVIGPVNVKIVRSDKHAIRLTGPTEQVTKTTVQLDEFQLNVVVPEGQVLEAVVYMQNLHSIHWQAFGNLTVNAWNSALLDITTGGEGAVTLTGKFGLRHLDIGGKTALTIHEVSSRSMTLRIRDQAAVILRGMAVVDSIELYDKAHLDLYWLDSYGLRIEAHNQSTVTLAGVADRLVALLQGNAQLNARFLRTREAYVKTYERALAEIQVTDNQNAVAYDESNIYFFTTPQFHASFMARDGSVLNFDGIEQAIRGDQTALIARVK
ncbi:MAG: hypothetical protein GKR77_00085 [Legionellales bacterium]|nr:hypothetical protein [Legionellales bacterium]